MLLTPHIVRTHEITEDDLKPIYIGSQQNLGVGGPPPLIARAAGSAAAGAPRRRRLRRPRRAPIAAASPWTRRDRRSSRRPASSPVPGTVLVAAAGARADAAVTVAAGASRDQPPPATPAGTPPAAPRRRRRHRQRAAAAADAAAVPTTSPGIGSAQVMISPPAPTLPRRRRTVHRAALDHERVAALDDHADADLRSDRSCASARCRRAASCAPAAVDVAFTQQVNGSRIDITITRAADATGASGTGLLAAILFDAIAPGAGDADAERHGDRPGRHGDGPAVPAGHGHVQ